jgi:hypothetical protein
MAACGLRELDDEVDEDRAELRGELLWALKGRYSEITLRGHQETGWDERRS